MEKDKKHLPEGFARRWDKYLAGSRPADAKDT